jgi:hypothetical protein
MIRNISLKFEVDTLRNKKGIVKNILLHQNFKMKSGRGRGRWGSRTALLILLSRAKNSQISYRLLNKLISM